MQWEITKQVLASTVRWALASLGVLFVRQGIIDEQTAEAWMSELTLMIVGAVLLAIPFIWRVLNARFNILALIAAVQFQPPADTPKEIKAAVEEVKREVIADSNKSIAY